MTKRGNIKNGPLAGRSKEYCWARFSEALPRNISPTDIDAMFEINGCFMFFEGKTEGTAIPNGQGRAMRTLMQKLPPREAIYIVGIHDALDRISPHAQLNTIQYCWDDGDKDLHWSDEYPGTTIIRLARLFVADAEAHGVLEPDRWQPELRHLGDPFEETA